MTNACPSRRTFLTASMALAAGTLASPRAAAPLTAREILERIKANVGIPWRTQTVDNLIAGSADTPVTGVATTMMATLDAVRRAAAGGMNMVITHEPTFFSHQDEIEPVRQDAVYQHKLDFLNSHGMVVFHFHDHWHARRPDGIATGMMRELGWDKNADPKDPKLFVFPGVPLADFAAGMAAKLGIRNMRVVGDPQLPVGRVLTSWGYASQMPGIPSLARPDVDVFVVGETREWELVEYAQDAIASGRKKALVILGHVLSEQAGMKYCAEWLRGFIKEVPVDFVPLPEPFWSPRTT
jgi:putative NIF3 family GTP cyclohydrolase 1 type 2